MSEKVTAAAHEAVVLAREEARLLNHDYVGTEHLLLGLIREGNGVAAEALAALGVSLEAVRDQVRRIIGVGQSPPSGEAPFTPRAGEVLALSLREARRSNQDRADTEHVLLGLIRAREGVAVEALTGLGADLDTLEGQIRQLRSGT